jgi:translocation and assembly module TamB
MREPTVRHHPADGSEVRPLPVAGAQPPRKRRWLRRAGQAVALVVVVIVAALVVVVRSLDQPWLKRRLQAMAHAKTGLDVDWTATHVRLFSGVRIDELVVRTPPALRGEAPELVRIGGLDVAWTARSLVSGTPRLTALTAESLALTLVRDEAGRTSLSTIEPTAAGPATPSPPASKQLAANLAGPPLVGRIAIARATVTVLARAAGAPSERIVVDGLALEASLTPAGSGFALHLFLGHSDAPLSLSVARARDGVGVGNGQARLWAAIDASPEEARVQLDVDVVAQTLSPSLHVAEVAHVEAQARAGDGKTTLIIDGARLADGAATLHATVEAPDVGPARIVEAAGVVDVPRLLALLPAALVPVAVEHAELRYDAAGVLLGSPPRLDGAGARLVVDGKVGRVRTLDGALAADGGPIHLRARPDGGDTLVDGHVPLRALTTGAFAADGVDAAIDGRIAHDGAMTGAVKLRFAALKLAGKRRVAARDAELAVRADQLRVDPALPLAARGTVSIGGGAASVALAHATTRIDASGVGWTVRGTLRGEPPYAIDAELPIARLRIADGKSLVDAPTKLVLHASDVRPDAIHPERTRGVTHTELALGPVHVVVDATKAADAVDWKVRADASSLGVIKALVPASAWSAPWERMGLTLASDGHAEHLAAPRVREQTTLSLTHAAFDSGHGSIAADRLDLAVKLAADAAAPSLRLEVTAGGVKAPELGLNATLGFDRTRRLVKYDLGVHAKHLGALASLFQGGLAGFDWEPLAVDLDASGTLAGLVDGFDKAGHPHVVPHPLATLAASGTLDLEVRGLDWSHGDRELSTPKAHFHAVLATAGERRLLQGALVVDALDFDVGEHSLELRGVRDEIEGSIAGDLRIGAAELTQKLRVAKVTQDWLDGYPVGDVRVDGKATRDADGVIRFPELTIDNRGGGTTLAVRGGLDAGAERRTLSLSGAMTQELARAWRDRGTFEGAGKLSVQLRLDSGNLRVFHALAAVRVAGATVRLPRAGIAVESMDGEIPLTADLVSDAAGFRLLRSTSVNAYSELRFADQHPLLSRPSFVSIARIVTPFVTLQPLAGNLRVDDNIVSLSQLELGVRGGRVTGQCILDWRPDDATLQLRVRATDVKSSHGEPFDGNAAVVLSTRERSVDGRAEILRIGKRHLLDLLDLDDPHHADPQMNRVRKAMALGYPDHLRLAFSHGFATVNVTFGGLARLVKIDTLRGIPMGPIIDKLLAPLDKRKEEEE